MRAQIEHGIKQLLAPAPSGARGRLVSVITVAVLLLVAVGLGNMSTTIGTLFQEKPSVLIGLPFIMILGFVFLLDRPTLLYLILLFRAGLDPILDLTKLPLGGSGMGLGAVLNGLILVLTISMVIDKGSARLKLARVFVPFLLITLVGVVRSPMPPDAFKLFLSVVTAFSAFIIGSYLADEDGSPDKVMKLVLWSSFVPSAMGLVMWSTGFAFSASQNFDAFEGAEANRFSGPFSHPNLLAFYCLLAIIALLYLWRSHRATNKGWVNVAAPLYLGVLIFFLLLTKTRSAWGACALVFFLYGLLFERRFLGYLALGLVLSTAVPSVQERIADVFQGTQYVMYAKLNSYAWRALLWEQALNWMPASSYPFGNGLESFRFNSTEFFVLSNRAMIGAHNVYLEVFFELGVVGLMAWVALLLAPALKILPLLKTRRLLAACGLLLVVLYAVVCYSDNMLSYLVVNIYFWLMVGAIVGLAHYEAGQGKLKSPMAKHTPGQS
jgi:putative inorganic carbon (HCO3(-)) transporter